MVTTETFNPREAALQHAAEAHRLARTGATWEESGEAVNAIACALVYVGDQIRALMDVTDEPDRVTLGDLREALLDVTSIGDSDVLVDIDSLNALAVAMYGSETYDADRLLAEVTTMVRRATNG